MSDANKILRIHLKQKLQCPTCNEFINEIHAQTAMSDRVFLSKMVFYIYYCPSCKAILNITKPT